MNNTGKLWIFCCGEVGEPQYFQSFKDEYKASRIKIVEIRRQAPWQMIDVIKKFQDTNEKYDKDDDEIWCVFDVDDYLNQNKKEFIKGIRNAKKMNINLAWSNESFELWFLMHFEYPLEIVGRGIYDKKLKKHFKDRGIRYVKNMPIYLLLKELKDTAQKNGKLLFKTHSNISDNPSSSVFILIERIYEFIQEINENKKRDCI